VQWWQPISGWVLELFYKLFHKSKKEARARIQWQGPNAGRPSDTAAPQEGVFMNIGIIGSVANSLRILQFFRTHAFNGIEHQIVGVANPKADSENMEEIRQAGIPVLDHHDRFFDRDDIDLILDLTDDPEIFKHILAHKKPTVRAMNYQTSRMFLDMYRTYEDPIESERRFLRASAIYKIVMTDLINEDVLVIAPNHQILDANDAVLKKVGLTRKEIIGRSCYEVTHRFDCPCTEDRCPCPMKEALTSMKPFSTTHVHLDKDNHEHHVSISCYPLMGPDGIIGAIEISKDITKDIQMQRTIMQQEKLASIGRLSAGVAHEINNPLTTILTSVMLLKEDFPAEHPVSQELELIAKETLRCRSIVTALLDFARQKTAEVKRCSINVIVQETVMLTRKQSAFKDIELAVSLDQKVPPLWVDPQQMVQALVNLIINAIESTDPGGRIDVSSEFDPDKKKVNIRVKDTGAGIPPGLLEQVFEPFFTTKESGTGLGLAITHGIIVQNGGRIEVASQPNHGTTFTITFPIKDGPP
jgi:nitrogen-specific signal transduction histidine kinase